MLLPLARKSEQVLSGVRKCLGLLRIATGNGSIELEALGRRDFSELELMGESDEVVHIFGPYLSVPPFLLMTKGNFILLVVIEPSTKYSTKDEDIEVLLELLIPVYEENSATLLAVTLNITRFH
ncbi:hypothetical protein HHK36_022253 [Tetracentron sinense]|uniref:Uncharacterized protein n=1 Tax=Tetracentron sinense TaxID=13715 RepID=A0A834YSJ8_TETSI|nr:hypothetical protein HHK36_022253 [Tetracentron sinense]